MPAAPAVGAALALQTAPEGAAPLAGEEPAQTIAEMPAPPSLAIIAPLSANAEEQTAEIRALNEERENNIRNIFGENALPIDPVRRAHVGIIPLVTKSLEKNVRNFTDNEKSVYEYLPSYELCRFAACKNDLELYTETIIKQTKETSPVRAADLVQRHLQNIVNDTTMNGKTSLYKGTQYNSICYSFLAAQSLYKDPKTYGLLKTHAENACTRYKIETRAARLLSMLEERGGAYGYNAYKNMLCGIYSITPEDAEKVRFFVWQTINRGTQKGDASLNRVLFLWGAEKKTGKTTLAKALASVLNACPSITGEFSTRITTEMQLNRFDKPKGTEYFCTLCDDTMPKDTRKIYGMFKSHITSDTCTIERKFINGGYTLPLYSNMIFTSNESAERVIQDDSERRVLSIHISKRPAQQMGEIELYNFCAGYVSAVWAAGVPEEYENAGAWYDSFGEEMGEKVQTKADYLQEMLCISTEFVRESLKTKPQPTGRQLVEIFYPYLREGADREKFRLCLELIKDYFAGAYNESKRLFSRSIFLQIFQTLQETQRADAEREEEKQKAVLEDLTRAKETTPEGAAPLAGAEPARACDTTPAATSALLFDTPQRKGHTPTGSQLAHAAGGGLDEEPPF